MKRFVLFAFIASALLSVSCLKEPIEGDYGTGKAQFTAILEKVDAGTKTTVEREYDYDLSGWLFKTKWESTDTINVNGVKCSATPDSENPMKAGFTIVPGSTMPSSPFTAFFPASMYDGTTATLPPSYVYKKGKYNMPMYAKSAETTLSFRNLCGVLAITVPNSNEFNYLKSVEVISSNQRMNGAFTVNSEGNLSFSSSAELTDADKKVTLTMDMTSGSIETGSTYYVPVPAGHHETLTITIAEFFEGDTQSMQTKKVEGVDVARNTVYEVSFVDNVVLPLTPDESEPAYCTPFVNIGGKKWAKWNIGATTEAETYKTCFGDYYQWGSLYRFYTDIYFGYDQNPYWEQEKQNYITYLGWTDDDIQEHLKTPFISFNFKPERKKGFVSQYIDYRDENVYEPKDIVQTRYQDVSLENDEGKWRMPTSEDFNDLIMDCWNNLAEVKYGMYAMKVLDTNDPDKGIYYLSADQTYLSEYKDVNGVLFVNEQKNKLFFPLTGFPSFTEVHALGEVGCYLSKSIVKDTDDEDTWYFWRLQLEKPGYATPSDMSDAYGYVSLERQITENLIADTGTDFNYPFGFSIRAVNDVMSDPVQAAPPYNDGVNSGDGVKIAGFWWAPFNCTASETNPYVYFQWGRKFGQAKSLGNITPTSMTKADDTEANKDKFGKSSNNWFEGVNNGLWRTGKGVGDPCPTGWRVPTKAELEALAKHFSGFVDNGDLKGRWFSGDQTYSETGPHIFLPAAGRRNGDSSNAGVVEGVDESAYYWSSTFNDDDSAFYLRFSEYETPSVVSDYEGKRVNGYTVRCIHQY